MFFPTLFVIMCKKTKREGKKPGSRPTIKRYKINIQTCSLWPKLGKRNYNKIGNFLYSMIGLSDLSKKPKVRRGNKKSVHDPVRRNSGCDP